MSSSSVINGTIKVTEEIFRFGVWDYMVFGMMLLVSTAIGVYFGFFAHSANTTDEYLMGGKKMKTLPIAISLVASQLSGMAIIAFPSEVYSFGINSLFLPLACVLVVPILSHIVIPVFYNNNISNCYEYLQRRFDARIRKFITIVFLLKVFLILPVYIFVPSLAFSQVSGINIHLINAVVCSICIFYTMLGGIKAVVWTDVFQAAVMLGSLLIVALIGLSKVGGLNEMITKARDGGRLNVDSTFDLTTRATLWNCFISGTLLWTSHVGFNQSCVQRIVATPSLRQGRIALVYFGIGLFAIMGSVHFTGLVMYAAFSDCDPIKAGAVEKADKLVPYFVQFVGGHIKGMPGFFISCVFSAALSTMSANLNSLSGIVYFDYIRPRIQHTEEKANLIMKITVLIVGIYCIVAGIIVEKFESLLQISLTVSGVAFGSLFGVFMLGILIPRAHSKPVYISLIISLITTIAIVLTQKVQTSMGILKYDPLPTTVAECSNLNITVTESMSITFNNSAPPQEAIHPFNITKMSFHWYATTGSLLVWLIGLPLSFLMSPEKIEKVDSKLFAPIVQRLVSKETKMQYLEVPLNEKRDIWSE